CVVDERGDRPELRIDLGEEPLYFVFLRYVGCGVNREAARTSDRLDDLLRLILAGAIVHADGVAGCRRQHGGGGTDPSACAGDEKHLLHARIIAHSRSWLQIELHDVRANGRFGHVELGEAGRQAEASWTCASWIQEQHAVFVRDAGLVRVAGDDYGDVLRRGIEIERFQIVQDMEQTAVHAQARRLRDRVRPRLRVVVAAHGGERGDPSELRQNALRTDVARVNDAIASMQELERLRTQEPVRV